MTECGCPHTNCEETVAINNTMAQYIMGGISGKSDDMRSAFHKDATIFGYVGEELFAGPIEMLFGWIDEYGPSPELTHTIECVDIGSSVATARVWMDDRRGMVFTDMFTLAKTEGKWKIISKVFHHHV